ncbi:hypothetical protein PLEOSDRAFT_39954 [Pleurotus ostreatus PC15]|uniref:Translation initiation factor eIF2B subunit gamma n=1 Tax=Pleurotus ostreatus (strain PC15) TaxID=1137138 RepID=A0A067NIM3_PLEO1|nr:hypothetical protein PLEOSDRAFT_39954 [Pleurotus ostreatus PC15]
MDLGVNAEGNSTIREFIAVVLAGFGNELQPLTSDNGDEPCPKALIPVANTPVIDYTLSWLEKSGVKDVLLICPATHRPALSHHIHSSTSTTLVIDVVPFDESPDSSIGPCTLLRHFASRITNDFILLPCDFIPPPTLSLSSILDKFRTETVSDGAIATTCWFELNRPADAGKDKTSPPEEWGSAVSPATIVYHEPSGTLLHIDTPDDVDQDGEDLKLRMSLLNLYPRTVLASRYQDSHVYVCKHSVIEALQQKEHFDSFKEDFLPWLCKVQYSSSKRKKYERVLNPITNSPGQSIALRHSTLASASNIALKSKSAHYAREATISPSDSDTEETPLASLRVGAVIHPYSAGFAVRVNTLPAFLEVNRHFLSQTSYSLPTDPANRSLIDQKAQISADSMVAASTKVEERVSIKKSVIGKHCVISRMARIVGCVILDHCVIAEGAKLDGSILGKGTKVGPKAELIRCVTQSGYEVAAGESFKNEKLEVSDWAATSASETDDNDEDGETEGTETTEGDEDEDEDEDN